MLTGYFDDAGGKDHGFTVVAGFSASLEQWREFGERWRALLSGFRVPYFHMLEIAHFKGPFEKWRSDPDARDQFLTTASRLIQENVLAGFVTIVQHNIYDKVNELYTLQEHTKSPYALAGFTCVEYMRIWALENRPGEPMEAVFEQGTFGHGGLSDLLASELKLEPEFSSQPHRGENTSGRPATGCGYACL